MRAFVYTFSREYTRDLSIGLIPLGVEPIEIATKPELFDSIEKHPDIRSLITEYPDVEMVGKIKTAREDIRITLLAHSHAKPEDIIRLSRSGIRHILTFTENIQEMADEILRSLMKDEDRAREKRQHYRVQPRAAEKLQANIFAREKRNFLFGNVVDISAGGFAIRLPETPDAELLRVGQTYDPVMLHIPGTQVKTLSTLVAKRQSIAGFKYDNVEPIYMKKIAEYIYQSLQQRGIAGADSSLMQAANTPR